MTVFDYSVLVIIGLSIVISMMRGLVKEVLSIIGWLAAFYVAKTYAYQLVPLLPESIPTEGLKILAAFVILFLATLLIASLIAITLSAIFSKLGLGWLNRFLGAFFGFARGMLIVCVLVFLAGLTSIPQDVRWQNAMFSAPIEALITSALPYLPEYIAKHVHFD